MWLFLLSIVAIGSVQTASIGYPYQSVWTYNPLNSGSLHGYLRYLDNNGAGSVVGFNNPQPVYAVRQIKYVKSAAPMLGASDETIRARETYLRAASLQQYQTLKRDIEALMAKGKEPSAEILLKLQRLEKIAFTSDFSLIADLPEVKSTLQDLEASISGLYRESVQQFSNQQTNVDQSQGEIKTYTGNSNIPFVAIEETPEQKQAREEHLRIYNEQIAHLKQLESEHQKYILKASSKSNIPQSQNEDKAIAGHIDNTKALKELERAQEEHFRLWNEAKLRAEQAGYENGERRVNEEASKQQISALTSNQNIFNLKQTSPNIKKPLTPEKQSSNEKNENYEEQNLKGTISASKLSQKLIEESTLIPKQLQTAYQSHVPQQVVDTPEVVRAREEHLRIVNEAILRAQRAPQLEENRQEDIKPILPADKLKLTSESVNQQSPIDQSQILQGASFAEQPLVPETPEVQRAREDHLRLVHEANLRAQFVEEQELKYKEESQKPILKSQYEQRPEISQNVQQTESVVKARAETLLLGNEAKINSFQNDKRIILPSKSQQQSSETQILAETPEVQRAREEHLRIFNSIKSHAEQEQAKQVGKTFPHPESLQKPLDFSLEEELERLREAERFQKEQQLLEFDRMREAERLAEEKRQMEAELLRLRLEEEQRLEMERLFEAKRLKEEQEELQKLQNGEYQEIIIQNDSFDQQPKIEIMPSLNLEQAHSQQNSEAVEKQNQQYVSNPFLKVGKVVSDPINRLEHAVSPHSSFFKTTPIQNPTNINQQNSKTLNSPAQSSVNAGPEVRYVQSSHQSGGSKHQYIKDDNIKHKYHNTASTQPADTAVALIALEKATNDHFRAHEIALEQLRLARIHNSAVKDCN